MTDELKPARCRCGSEAIILGYRGRVLLGAPLEGLPQWYVQCTRLEDTKTLRDYMCWSGSTESTKSEAIQAWNEVMEDD